MIVATLGLASFYWASSPESIWQQDVESLQFPGTDGADFRLLGFHSREWQMETLSDFFNSLACYTELENYRNLNAQPPQQLVHYNNDFDARQFRVKVMHVEPGNSQQRAGVKQHAGICGGRFPSSFGYFTVLAATWTLKWTLYQP